MEIRAEHDKLSKERRDLKPLLKSDDLQWERIADEIKATREAYSKKTELGRRRTTFADAPAIEVDLDQAMIEKEPITVLLSEKGWIRALKGHLEDLSKLEFKQGDSLKRAVPAFTTDKCLLFATNGKFFTLEANKLPGGRGHGEPRASDGRPRREPRGRRAVRARAGRKLLVASSGATASSCRGRGRCLDAQGQAGAECHRAREAKVCVPVAGDQVATVGENRKMLVFALDEVNEMTRGKGIILQRFKDGGLSDARVFKKSAGLTWLDSAGRTFTLSGRS